MALENLYPLFPRLKGSPHRQTSDIDSCYNCIAWAANDTEHKWWPFAYPPYGHWPDGAPRDESVASFIAAFRTLGYEPCENGESQPGFEKLAIYADDNGTVTHMARQVPSGAWTSKCGDLEDIEHSNIEALHSDGYGTVVQFLRRQIP